MIYKDADASPPPSSTGDAGEVGFGSAQISGGGSQEL
jgi:hypothetical protein